MAHILPDANPGASSVNDRERDRLLDVLRGITPERVSLDRREFAFIQAVRALGATWDQIADALGHGSPQERYGELRERFAPDSA